MLYLEPLKDLYKFVVVISVLYNPSNFSAIAMPKREADLSDSDSLSDDSSSEEAPVKKPRKQSSDEAPAKKAPKPESTSSDEAPVKKPLKQKAAAREVS